jgi:hypothetical protein
VGPAGAQPRPARRGAPPQHQGDRGPGSAVRGVLREARGRPRRGHARQLPGGGGGALLPGRAGPGGRRDRPPRPARWGGQHRRQRGRTGGAGGLPLGGG